MGMAERSYSVGSGYRYGFNGKENDNDVKGEGNQQDYGMRIYDPRIGKFLSVDPITQKYPELTPYQFASNKPINSIDLDGSESLEVYIWKDEAGRVTSLQVPVSNPWDLGSGILYHTFTMTELSSTQVNKFTVEVDRRRIEEHKYVPPAKGVFGQICDWVTSKVPQIQVWG